MPRKPIWRPRASSIGAYFGCDYRAAFDRALAAGLYELSPEHAAIVEQNRRSSPWADFGTCVHFHLQDGLRCAFPGPSTEFAPEPAQVENARRIWGGDPETCEAQIRLCATLAAQHMPTTADGLPWLAESEWEDGRFLQGHIDFLSHDYLDIVDLKTTSKPPPGGKAHPKHIVQLLGYRRMVGRRTGVYPKRGMLLYVSSRSEWAIPTKVDFEDPGMQEYAKHVDNYLAYLTSAALFKYAVPRIGDVCSDDFCPYRGVCRDVHLKGVTSPGMAAASLAAPQLNIAGLLS